MAVRRNSSAVCRVSCVTHSTFASMVSFRSDRLNESNLASRFLRTSCWLNFANKRCEGERQRICWLMSSQSSTQIFSRAREEICMQSAHCSFEGKERRRGELEDSLSISSKNERTNERTKVGVGCTLASTHIESILSLAIFRGRLIEKALVCHIN